MKLSLAFSALVATLTLSGCAPSPHLHATTKFMNGGQGLNDGMLDRNLIATAAYDENFVDEYPLPGRATAYIQGVIKGSAEYKLRVVGLNLRLFNATLVTDGKYGYSSSATVPDHIGRIKAWDLVEYRSTGTYDTLLDFTKKQEGNIIVRVLCRKADPDYEKCRDALPQQRNYPNGPTGTPFPASIKEYGYTFTPAYDDKGTPLRVIPEYVPKKL
jgi:hypothetical protein